jgi:hypothetical protein
VLAASYVVADHLESALVCVMGSARRPVALPPTVTGVLLEDDCPAAKPAAPIRPAPKNESPINIPCVRICDASL